MVGGRAVKDGKMWPIGENRLEPLSNHAPTDYMCRIHAHDECSGPVRQEAALTTCRRGQAVLRDRSLFLPVDTAEALLVRAGTFANDVWSSDDGVEWTCVCESAPW